MIFFHLGGAWCAPLDDGTPRKGKKKITPDGVVGNVFVKGTLRNLRRQGGPHTGESWKKGMAPTDPPAVAKALVHAIQAHSASHRGHTGCTNSNSLRCFVMVAGLPHVSVTMWAPSGSDWQSEYLRMDMSTETGFSAAQRDNGSRGGMTRGMSSASSAAASDESAAVACLVFYDSYSCREK